MSLMALITVLTSLVGVFATSHAMQTPWTVACFWTKDFQSNDSVITNCNHVIYEYVNAYHNIDSDSLTLNFNPTHEGYKTVMSFKEKTKVKVELSVGDWQTPKQLYDIARNRESRRKFIDSCIKVLEQNKFDGLHLMWGSPADDAKEYLINSTKIKIEKENLTKLLKELSMRLKNASSSFSFGIRGVLEIDCNMEVEEVYANADLVFVYAYGYHGAWEESTGAYSPIYPGIEGTERVNSYYMTVDSTWDTLEVWGGKPDKTVLVISAKGNPFKLANSSQHDINAPDEGGWKPQITFTNICQTQLNQTEGNWSVVWDNTRKQSYTYKGNSWITYEDVCSVIEKKKYAKEKKFRGLALKDLGRDDANGECVRKTLPLLVNVTLNFSQIGQSEVYLDTTFPLLRIIAEEREQSNPCNGSCGNFDTYFPRKLPLLLLLLIAQL